MSTLPPASSPSDRLRRSPPHARPCITPRFPAPARKLCTIPRGLPQAPGAVLLLRWRESGLIDFSFHGLPFGEWNWCFPERVARLLRVKVGGEVRADRTQASGTFAPGGGPKQGPS